MGNSRKHPPNSLRQRDLHRKNYRSSCSGFRSCQDSGEFNTLTDHEEAKLKDPYTSQTCFLQLCSHSGFDWKHQLLASLSFWFSTPFPANPTHYYYSAWYRRLKFSWLTSLSFKTFDCNTVHISASPLLAGIVASSVA